MSPDVPVVFLGPSLPVTEARTILAADYRPPIRRGDLERIASGTVAIIDGVFDQDRPVDPTEIRAAIARGVTVYGASSMGALRATEVPQMIGVGRVHQMYVDHEIEDDDEVALVFDPTTYAPFSVPMVNIRYAVSRLVSAGTIDAKIGARIVAAAKALHYPHREYRRILKEARLASRSDTDRLRAMLEANDLKRNDAVTLLEKLAARVANGPSRRRRRQKQEAPAVAPSLPAGALRLWEYGEPVAFEDLVAFLKVTGTFASYARNAAARFVLAGNELATEQQPEHADLLAMANRAIIRTAVEWDCLSSETENVLFADLGVSADDVREALVDEANATGRVMALARDHSPEFLRALRVELFMNELALKRELIRCGSVELLARHGAAAGPPTREELAAARAQICERVDARDWQIALAQLRGWGLDGDTVDRHVASLALARRAAAELRRAVPAKRAKRRSLRLAASPKAAGDRRFCLPIARALRHAQRLVTTIGISRVSVITGLDAMGIPVAQAFRDNDVWAITVGSGKSTSPAGAKIGSIMEEVEKWAQEKFPAAAPPEVAASFRSLGPRAIDPRTLDLPHDTRFDEDLVIGWRPCHDLVTGTQLLVPSAALDVRRTDNDIYYSERGARKVMSTNGLASGFTLEEALTHAISELVERHSNLIADLVMNNPGARTPDHYRSVDLTTAPASTQQLVAKIRAAGYDVNVLDITSDLGVPTFLSFVLSEATKPWTEAYGGGAHHAEGHAAHPDPEVAINGAVLESVQTRLANIAGAREDLTIRARSLGRHERTRARTRTGMLRMRGPSSPQRSFAEVPAFISRDARADVEWLVERLRVRGFRHVLVADYSLPEIAPARVVRVIVPELVTNSPLSTPLRGRLELLRDLL